jgi:hypothetical protein
MHKRLLYRYGYDAGKWLWLAGYLAHGVTRKKDFVGRMHICTLQPLPDFSAAEIFVTRVLGTVRIHVDDEHWLGTVWFRASRYITCIDAHTLFVWCFRCAFRSLCILNMKVRCVTERCRDCRSGRCKRCIYPTLFITIDCPLSCSQRTVVTRSPRCRVFCSNTCCSPSFVFCSICCLFPFCWFPSFVSNSSSFEISRWVDP